MGAGVLATERWDSVTRTLTLKLVKKVGCYWEDLPGIRPRLFKLLQEHCVNNNIELVTASEFMSRYVFRLGYPGVFDGYEQGAVAGANISFDLFRFATRITEPRGQFYGGTGCEFLNGDPDMPRYHEIQAGIGKRRSFALTARRGSSRRWEPPAIIDVLDMARALTGKRHSLLSAGKAFKCPVLKYDGAEIHDPEVNYTGSDLGAQIMHYIGYMFNDVDATASLYEAVMTRFLRHPVDMPPESMFSSASLLKRYLREMGTHPPLCTCETCVKTKRGAWGIPDYVHGLCMASYYGARAETATRLESLPSLLGDWKSAYPAQIILNKTWEMKTANRIEYREAASDVQAWLTHLAELGLDSALAFLRQPENWPPMVGIAEFQADGNQRVPVRAEYGASYMGTGATGIGIQYLKQSAGDPPACYAIADIAASVINSLARGGNGAVPEIKRAYQFWPSEDNQRRLKPVDFNGNPRLRFNPDTDNLARFLVEERQRIKDRGDPDSEAMALKEMANGGLYGVDAEMNIRKRDPKRPTRGKVYGLDSQAREVRNPEELGEWTCPILATVITAGERLMLAMFEAELLRLGVVHQFCDTDSMCVPATPDGTGDYPVKVLSYDQYWEIAGRFDSLNPYNRELIPHLIELQQPETNPDGSLQSPVLTTAISAKRYVMYRRDGNGSLDIVKRSEHGLGQYRNPRALYLFEDGSSRPDWISEAWEYMLRQYVFKEQNVLEPPWLDLPAVSYFPVSTQHVLKAFKYFNQDKPLNDQIRPGNFYMAVHRDRGSKVMADSQEFRLMAPLGNPLDSNWVDLHTGQAYEITTDLDAEIPGRVLYVKTYRNALYEYITHAEYKYQQSGKACGFRTRGILEPSVIVPESYKHVSKDGSSFGTAREDFEGQAAPRVYYTNASEIQDSMCRDMFRAKSIGRITLMNRTGVSKKVSENFMRGTTVHVQRQEDRNAIMGFGLKLAQKDLKACDRLWSSLHTPGQILTAWHRALSDGVISQVKWEPPVPVIYSREIITGPDSGGYYVESPDNTASRISDTECPDSGRNGFLARIRPARFAQRTKRTGPGTTVAGRNTRDIQLPRRTGKLCLCSGGS